MNVEAAKLKNVMGNLFKISPDMIDEEASMDTIEAWDSLNHLKLVLALEEEFNISFTEEESIEILSYQLIKEVLRIHDVVVVE